MFLNKTIMRSAHLRNIFFTKLVLIFAIIAAGHCGIYAGDPVWLEIQGENDNVAFAVTSLSAEHGINNLGVKVVNKSPDLRVVALNLQNRPGYWYGGYGTQFCIVLPETQSKELIIPVSTEYFKLTEQGTSFLSVYEAKSEALSRWQILESRNQLYYGQYFPDWRFCNTICDIEYTDTLFSGRYNAKELFPDLWSPYTVFNRYSSERLEVYIHKESIANDSVDIIIKRRELALDTLSALLDVHVPHKLRLVFYPDSHTKTFDTGHTGMGYAFGRNVIEIYNENEKLADYHEIAHIIIRLIGNPPIMLNEGFAVYADELLGADAIAPFGYNDMSIDQAARKLIHEESLIPFDQLISFVEIGSPDSRPEVSYVQSASFTKYLIENFGFETFRKLLENLQNSDQEEIVVKNREMLQSLTGLSLGEHKEEWFKAVTRQAD